MNCPYCHTEVQTIEWGDDVVDYCYECDRVMEGEAEE